MRGAHSAWLLNICLLVGCAGVEPDAPVAPQAERVDPGAPLPTCGDGWRAPGEACDGDDVAGLTCADFDPEATGTLSCTAQCTLKVDGCTLPGASRAPTADTCGDGEPCSGVGNIIGDVDWVPAWEVHEPAVRAVARASGRLDYRVGRESYRCSATLIGPDLLITNHHCAPDADTAATARFVPLEPGATSRFDGFRCPELVATDCGHDVSILRCERHPVSGRLPGEVYGVAPIEFQTPERRDDIFVVHTNCDYRDHDGDGRADACTPIKLVSPGQITRYGRECITFSGEAYCGNCRSDVAQARHDADTLGGSSGGGIFDRATGRLIGLNWGGTVAPNNTGGTNFFASLADLADARPDFAAVLEPLAAGEPMPPEPPLSPDALLALAIDGEPWVTLDAVTVTAVVPTIGRTPGGFVVQASADGPALLVEAEAPPVRPGQVISVAVDGVRSFDGRPQAPRFVNLEVTGERALAELRTGLDAFADADALEAATLRLVQGRVQITDAFLPAGTDWSAAVGAVDASGLPLVVRLPEALRASEGVEPGCEVTFHDVPLWRYRSVMQVQAWGPEDLSVSCPEPAVDPLEPADAPEPEPPHDEAAAPCLIINEYVEGAGYDKGVELLNCGAALDLSAVTLCLESNGGDARHGCSRATTLRGTLAPGAVLTLCHRRIRASVAPEGGCDLVDDQLANFNGDDRLAVFIDADGDRAIGAGETVLDAFGELGARPSGRPWADQVFQRVVRQPYAGVGSFELSAWFEVGTASLGVP